MDAHGKNFLFLIEKSSVKLSLFYDLLSTQIYPSFSCKIAIKIKNKYETNGVRRRYCNKTEFIDKEVKCISNMFNARVELIASGHSPHYARPNIISGVLQAITDNLGPLEQQ